MEASQASTEDEQRVGNGTGTSHGTSAGTGSPLELFTVTVVATLMIGAVVLARISWKHLRSRSVAPADAPIVVE